MLSICINTSISVLRPSKQGHIHIHMKHSMALLTKREKPKKKLDPEEQRQIERNLLQKTRDLPEVLIGLIHSYLTIPVRICLCRIDYFQYHSLLRKYILSNEYENYIRDVIRRDHDFVFEPILRENYKKWLSMKQYHYKNSLYLNYLYFLKDFCMMNDSTRCRNLLYEFMEIQGLGKNLHKKNVVRNIRST